MHIFYLNGLIQNVIGYSGLNIWYVFLETKIEDVGYCCIQLYIESVIRRTL